MSAAPHRELCRSCVVPGCLCIDGASSHALALAAPKLCLLLCAFPCSVDVVREHSAVSPSTMSAPMAAQHGVGAAGEAPHSSGLYERNGWTLELRLGVDSQCLVSGQ